jgi:methylmalonyl-CoA mutase
VESLTKELADKAWALMEQIEAMGGMTKAVASGWPKQQIEEAATRKQAYIDKGEDVIVGVNKYRLEEEAVLVSREVDNRAVRAGQIKRLEHIKRSRSPELVQSTLAALETAARSGKGNILEIAVEAARARATVGEMSDALRIVFGDHSAKPEVVKHVHGDLYKDDSEYKLVSARLKSVTSKMKHAPRMLIAKLGQDGHDRGAKIIASAFGDLGFEVVAGPLFQTPQEAADLAISENVQIIGVSSLAAGHKTLLPELTSALKAKSRADIIVVCGGVVPRGDYEFLMQSGVSAIFGPGTNVLDAMRSVLDLLEGKRRNT